VTVDDRRFDASIERKLARTADCFRQSAIWDSPIRRDLPATSIPMSAAALVHGRRYAVPELPRFSELRLSLKNEWLDIG
jgi:hypothetical protein